MLYKTVLGVKMIKSLLSKMKSRYVKGNEENNESNKGLDSARAPFFSVFGFGGTRFQVGRPSIVLFG